jgi:hypothetical protein
MLNGKPIQDCATCQSVRTGEEGVKTTKLIGDVGLQYVSGKSSNACGPHKSSVRLNRCDLFPSPCGVSKPGSNDAVQVGYLDRVVVYDNQLPDPKADELLTHMRSGSACPNNSNGQAGNPPLPLGSECSNLSVKPLVRLSLRCCAPIIGTNPDVAAGPNRARLWRGPGANRLTFLANDNCSAWLAGRTLQEWQ